MVTDQCKLPGCCCCCLAATLSQGHKLRNLYNSCIKVLCQVFSIAFLKAMMELLYRFFVSLQVDTECLRHPDAAADLWSGSQTEIYTS